MGHRRSPLDTVRSAKTASCNACRTTKCCLFVLALGLLLVAPPGASVFAADETTTADVITAEQADRALRTVLRTALPPADRLEFAAQALQADSWSDAELGFRAGLALLPVDEQVAAWLLRRAGQAVALRDALRDEVVQSLQTLPKERPATDARVNTVRAALGVSFGLRPDGVEKTLTSVWPPSAYVEAVLRDEFGESALAADAATAASVIAARLPASRALDEANRDDAERTIAGLTMLVNMTRANSANTSLPLLLHEAARAAALETPDGRGPRACRAITVLGQSKNRAATPILRKCLYASDGWVRHCAAVALGDIGDPAAVPDLVWYLRRMSDRFRNRDQWDYPGPNGTPIAQADWSKTDYYVVDIACADALLRMGIPNAAGYVIAEKLDPSKVNSRIRVYQDALDTLLRARAPAEGYNVDQGLPLRQAAFEGLSAWFLDSNGTWLGHTIDESDAGFVEASLELAEKLRSNDARSFIITQRCVAMIGPPMTPALLTSLGRATKMLARSEIAQALGGVNDPRAVEPLRALLRDPKPTVREKALIALGAYARTHDELLPLLLQALASKRPGAQVAALQALVRAPRDERVLKAVTAMQTDDPRAARARSVILLVQSGMAHWAPIAEGLQDQTRHIRRDWWDLLRVALRLPAHAHDAQNDPVDSNTVTIERSRVESALAKATRGRK